MPCLSNSGLVLPSCRDYYTLWLLCLRSQRASNTVLTLHKHKPRMRFSPLITRSVNRLLTPLLSSPNVLSTVTGFLERILELKSFGAILIIKEFSMEFSMEFRSLCMNVGFNVIQVDKAVKWPVGHSDLVELVAILSRLKTTWFVKTYLGLTSHPYTLMSYKIRVILFKLMIHRW